MRASNSKCHAKTEKIRTKRQQLLKQSKISARNEVVYIKNDYCQPFGSVQPLIKVNIFKQ